MRSWPISSSHTYRHTLLSIHLGDQVVGRVRDDGTQNTSNVAGTKGYTQLLPLAAFRLGLGHHILVQGLDSVLEGTCSSNQVGRGSQVRTVLSMAPTQYFW